MRVGSLGERRVSEGDKPRPDIVASESSGAAGSELSGWLHRPAQTPVPASERQKPFA